MDRLGTSALLGLIAAAGCAAAKDTPTGLGTPVVSGTVRAFAPSADGAWLAFLDGCREVKSTVLPPQTASCDLRVVPAAGGEAKRFAQAVTTLPYGLAWGRDGSLAALAAYDYANASGTLVHWRAGVARELASNVTFSGFGADGELGFVSGGKLSVLLPGEAGPREVKGADRVASFELSPGGAPSCSGIRLAAREARAAGGGLLVSGCDLREARSIEHGQVGEYGFSSASPHLAYTVQEKDGAELKLVRTAPSLASWVLGGGVRSFAFSASGKNVAFLGGAVPGKQGDLFVAAAGAKAVRLAKDVGELRWARDAERLAWLERYDPRIRAGTLGGGGPGMAARTFGTNVSDFEISPDGRHVAYLQHSTRGGYSVDLGLGDLDAPKEAGPTAVAQGVFGFGFSPDGKWLYYRTRCTRNAEACDLDRVPAAGLPAGAKPEAIAQKMKSFEFDPRDPERILLTWQRMDLVALDVGVWEKGKITSVDTHVAPGSVRFLGPDSRRLAYVVIQPKRQGLYVANLAR